jgi:hypothetical protein
MHNPLPLISHTIPTTSYSISAQDTTPSPFAAGLCTSKTPFLFSPDYEQREKKVGEENLLFLFSLLPCITNLTLTVGILRLVRSSTRARHRIENAGGL